jgi:hypothetical protein
MRRLLLIALPLLALSSGARPAAGTQYYNGCVGPRVAGIDRRLAAAPGLLPLARFIRARPNRR